MPLWHTFRWEAFFKNKLGWTALGGGCVTAALILYERSGTNWLGAAAKHALSEVRTGMAGPNDFILLIALLFFLGCVAFSGAFVSDVLAKGALRPVLGFCLDAVCLGVGVVVALSLFDATTTGLLQAVRLLITAIILHGALTLVDWLLSSAASKTVKNAASAAAALGLVAVYLAGRQ